MSRVERRLSSLVETARQKGSEEEAGSKDGIQLPYGGPERLRV